MQHLRKFNELFYFENSELDIKYFEECFIEFLDSTKENEYNYSDNEIDKWGIIWQHKNDEYWHIRIFFPDREFKNVDYIAVMPNADYMKEVSEYNDLISEVYKDINVSVDKVKIKYPDVDFVFDFSYDKEQYYKSPVSIGIYIYKNIK